MLTPEALLNHLNHAILLVDKQLCIQYCNEAVSQLWERDIHRFIDKSLQKLFLPNETVMDHLHQVFNEGKDFHFVDYTLVIFHQVTKIVEISLTPIFDAEAKVHYVVITLLDQTQMAGRMAKEKKQSVMDSIGDLLFSIAHEIQNPLSGIKGVTQLLQRDMERRQMPIDSTEMILKELNRIDRLLKQLLFHAQPLPLDYSTFNLHELLNTVIWFEENSLRGPIHFQRLYDPSLPELTADRDKLHQVFLNLIKNAVEAMPAGGEITIRTNYCPRWKVLAHQLPPHREYYLIEVEDQGEGIPSEKEEQIFKPLFTTKRKGTGLGLSISFRIISEHGGLLRYKAAETKGAIFQIYLPQTPS